MNNFSEEDKCSLMPEFKNRYAGWFRQKDKKKKVVWIQGKIFVNTLYLLTALVDFEKSPFTYEEFFQAVLLNFCDRAFPEISLLYLFMFGGVMHTKVSPCVHSVACLPFHPNRPRVTEHL